MELRFNRPFADSVSSLSFSQVSNLLQINFNHHRFYASPLSTLYLQFLFHLISHKNLFEVKFVDSFLLDLRSKLKSLRAPKKTSRHSILHTTSRAAFNRPHLRSIPKAGLNKSAHSFFLHHPFLKFRRLFKQQQVPLFNPTIRIRRRKYALFQEKTPFVKNIKVNSPRKRWKRKSLKFKSRRFSRVKRLWAKVVLRKFSVWKKMRLLKRRAKSKIPFSVPGSEIQRYIFKFLRHVLHQTPFLVQLHLSGQASTDDLQKFQKSTPAVIHQLTFLFSQFIVRWLFKKKSKLTLSNRSDFLPFAKKSLSSLRSTSNLHSVYVQRLATSYSKPVRAKVRQNLVSTPELGSSMTTKTPFLFRRYLTHILQDTLPCASARTFRTVRPRRFVRRKRARLPRALHFLKPRRSNLASFRSSSTFRYLFRRAVVLKRRISLRKKSSLRLQKRGGRGRSACRVLTRRYQTSLFRKSLLLSRATPRHPILLQSPSSVTPDLQNCTPFWNPVNRTLPPKIYSSKPKRRRSKKLGKLHHRRLHFTRLFRCVRESGHASRLPSSTYNQAKLLVHKFRPLFRSAYYPHPFRKYRRGLGTVRYNRRKGFKKFFRGRRRRFMSRRLRRASRYRVKNYKSFLRRGRPLVKLRTRSLKQKGVSLLKKIFRKNESKPHPFYLESFNVSQKLNLNSTYVNNLTKNSHIVQSVKFFKNRKQSISSRQPKSRNHRRHLTFKSLRKLPFILSATGFLYNRSLTRHVSLKSSSYIRCTKYSFFNALRIKRFILKERIGRSVFSKRTISRTISNLAPYARSLEQLNPYHTLHAHREKAAPYLGDFLSMNADWTLSQPWERGPGVVRNEYNLRIRRIRFKPGYSRIWRQARTALMQVLDLRFRYQHRLTVYLGRFAHIASRVHKKLLDIRVHTLLIRSRFVFDLTTANSLVTSRLVFVNGRAVLNSRMLLFVGDVLQLIIHLKFYIVYRWLLNWYTFKTHRRARLARSKFKKVSHAQTKQRSSRLPDWLLKARSVNRDIPKFVEVDFFTLSSFIVYSPFSKNDLEVLDLLDSRLEVYNMYNWKYIN